MARSSPFPVDENGDIVVWKAVAGAKQSHRMSRPVFPQHQPNYNLDKGALVRIKSLFRLVGPLPLESEYARRR